MKNVCITVNLRIALGTQRFSGPEMSGDDYISSDIKTHQKVKFKFTIPNAAVTVFRFHWIHNATAYNHAYEDAGLFCIHASGHPSHLGDLTQIITRELTAMNGRMSKEELEVGYEVMVTIWEEDIYNRGWQG